MKIYKDLISGTNALKRDSFQRMIEDAQDHKFEVVLVFHTSRFARNVKEARHYKDLLRSKLGIDVISISQNFGDFNDPESAVSRAVASGNPYRLRPEEGTDPGVYYLPPRKPRGL